MQTCATSALWLMCMIFCIGNAGTTDAAVIEKKDVQHYPVDGSKAATLKAALNAATPIRENGQLYHGYTKWEVRWHYTWQRAANGRCRIDSVTTDLQIRMTLPELKNASPAMQEQFIHYYTALRVHEEGHVQNGRAAAHDIDQKLLSWPVANSCEALESAANNWGMQRLQEANAEDIRYDQETGHGRTQGAVLPR